MRSPWLSMALVVLAGCSSGSVIRATAPDASVEAGGVDGAALEAGADGDGAGCPFGDAGPGSSPSSPPRVPLKHRPAGSACPQQRAAISPEASTCTPPDSGACGPCSEDSDCNGGPNGRCGPSGPFAYRTCSYDGCFGDSDCDKGEPCQCRESSSSPAANICLTGSGCRDDSECGPGGTCSPSALSLCSCPAASLCGDAGGCYEYTGSGPAGLPPGPGWTSVPCACGDSCGHGYFCHTPCDTCVDDGDCGGTGTCNYDALAHRWQCAECWPVP